MGKIGREGEGQFFACNGEKKKQKRKMKMIRVTDSML